MADGMGVQLMHALVDLAEYRIIVVESQALAKAIERGFPGPVEVTQDGDVWIIRAV